MGAGRTFIAGADIKELEQAAWGGGSGPPNIHDLLARIEDCGRPGGDGAARHAAWRRPRTGDGGPLPRGAPGHADGAARGEPGHHSRRRRDAAPDPARRRREGHRDVRLGQADWRRRRAGGRPRRSADQRRPARRRRRICSRDRRGGSTARAKTRDRREKLGTPESNAPLLAAGRELARKTRRNMLAPLEGGRRDRGCGHAAVSDGVPPRARDLLRVPALGPVQGARARVLRRARRSRACPTCRRTRRRSPIATRRDHRRRHDGQRHRDGVRQRRVCSVVLTDVDAGRRRSRHGRRSAATTSRPSSAAGCTPEEAERAHRPDSTSRPATTASPTADLVIEAVFENLALKKQVFAAIDAAAKPGCILATNTSTLGHRRDRRRRRRGPRRSSACTSSAPRTSCGWSRSCAAARRATSVLATALAFAKRLGKVGVVVAQRPGLCRQPDDVPVHVRGAVPRRGRRDARSRSIAC